MHLFGIGSEYAPPIAGPIMQPTPVAISPMAKTLTYCDEWVSDLVTWINTIVGVTEMRVSEWVVVD